MIAATLTALPHPARLRVESSALQALEALLASKSETVVLRAAIGVLNHLERLRRHEAKAAKAADQPAAPAADPRPPCATSTLAIRPARQSPAPPAPSAITSGAPAARLIAVAGGPRATARSP